MSKTTIAIPVIKKVTGLSKHTIDKLYDVAGVPQPRKVHVRNDSTHTVCYPREITSDVIKANRAAHVLHKANTQHIGDYIVEDVVLSDYICIKYTYKLKHN